MTPLPLSRIPITSAAQIHMNAVMLGMVLLIKQAANQNPPPKRATG